MIRKVALTLGGMEGEFAIYIYVASPGESDCS
jgi:hypothetical protein